jgi:glycosyltransferase involved in cell wall biosynthesis
VHELSSATRPRSVLQTLAGTAAQWSRYARQRLACFRGHTGTEAGTPHLLLLAWLFPPKVSGGVYRPLSFAKYAHARGWKVTVVAAPLDKQSTAAGEYLLGQLPDAVRVVRVQDSAAVVSHKAFPRIDGGFLNVLDTFDTVRAALAEAPTVVLSSGPPFHNFPAGWMLSRYFRCPLVLDYRDEWTNCPFPFIKLGNVDTAWERRCLRDADAVVMTTRSFIDHALARFPELSAERTHCIMNGWEPADLPVLPHGPAAAIGQRNNELVYLGYLGEHAPVDGFLQTLDAARALVAPEAQDFLLRFVGSRSASATQSLRANAGTFTLRVDDQVPKPEALRIMREARAVLLINEPDLSRYIPGKLFDYIASRTPVLVYGDGGEVGRIVRETGAGFVVPSGDTRQLAAALSSLAAGQLRPDPATIDRWLAMHTREQSAMNLIELLGRIARAPRGTPQAEQAG